MNKIYNVVYSEEHGTWVVCSELDKRGRKKSSRASTGKLLASAAIMGASLASLPAQASTCGDGSTVASGRKLRHGRLYRSRKRQQSWPGFGNWW